MKTIHIIVGTLWTNTTLSEDGTSEIYCIPEGEYLYFWDFYNFILFPTRIGLRVYGAGKIYLRRFIAWMLCFALYSALGGSMGLLMAATAFLLSAFVLKGFLTSQPKNTQALLLLPRGKKRTGNSLIERKPACTPSRWAHCGVFDHSEREKRSVRI